jgi:hypothetical protein
MNAQLETQTIPKTTSNPLYTPVARGLLQRQCARGQHSDRGSECESCRKKHKGMLQRAAVSPSPVSEPPSIVYEALRSPGQPPDPATRAFIEPRFGHDFSRVQTHSDARLAPASPALRLSINGAPATSSPEGLDAVFSDGPAPSPSSPAPAPRPQPPPTRGASNCPADIKVAVVGQGNDVEFGQKGPITGWGGFALMEVSDPGGKTWDGTAIHETLRNIKNTCGNQGNNACSNRSGEGGRIGSSFEVGKESNFLGLAKLAAARNRFYDLHVFATKGSSLLHLLNQPDCEIQCEQFYDCGGRRFGPDFIITYSMTRDAVARSGGGSNGVTRVEVRKAAKTTPAASPTARSGGATP